MAQRCSGPLARPSRLRRWRRLPSSHSGALSALYPMRVKLVSVPTDDSGILPEALDRLLLAWDAAKVRPCPHAATWAAFRESSRVPWDPGAMCQTPGPLHHPNRGQPFRRHIAAGKTVAAPFTRIRSIRPSTPRPQGAICPPPTSLSHAAGTTCIKCAAPTTSSSLRTTRTATWSLPPNARQGVCSFNPLPHSRLACVPVFLASRA
jgi:hypothetical protein